MVRHGSLSDANAGTRRQEAVEDAFAIDNLIESTSFRGFATDGGVEDVPRGTWKLWQSEAASFYP